MVLALVPSVVPQAPAGFDAGEGVKGDTKCRKREEEGRSRFAFFKVRTNHANGAPLQAACLSEAGVERVIFPFRYYHGMLSTWYKR